MEMRWLMSRNTTSFSTTESWYVVPTNPHHESFIFQLQILGIAEGIKVLHSTNIIHGNLRAVRIVYVCQAMGTNIFVRKRYSLETIINL